MKLDTAIDHFISGYFSTCRRSNKTRSAYSFDLSQFRHFAGDSSLDAVTVDSAEQWATALKDRGYAARSIRRKFATLRVFFSYWVRRGELVSSPLWRIRIDFGRQQDLPRNLTASDSKRLIEAAWTCMPAFAELTKTSDKAFLALRDLAAVEILFATGMRVGELVTLRVGDWRQDEKSLLVKGKGAKERLAFLTDQRSVSVLDRYIKGRRLLNLQHDNLLINARGQRLSTQGVSRILRRLSTIGDVQGRVTPHMIRHTVATLLLRNGADIRVVQEILGHASIVTTQRYTHVSKEHVLSTLRSSHPNHHLEIQQNSLRN